MREGRVSIWLILLCFLFTYYPTLGQQAREQFGKNRVQYEVFNWRFFSSDNFDVYFYDEGEDAAREAINFLEEEFDRITDVIGYSPYSKTKVFLYNSVADLQQSNVGINDLDYSEGGQTDFIKAHVEIAHPGTISGFKEDLVYHTSRLLINDMMFGGSLTDMFQSAYLLHLPAWFVEGASAYIANGWDMEMDNYIRDFVGAQSSKKLSRLIGDDARLAGQSIWNYIAETYGRSSISNILNLTRIIRNEEKSISNTLGLSFRQFLNDWEAFYLEIKEEVGVDYQDPASTLQVLGKNRKGYKYSQVRLSPDASKLAYVRNYNGRYSVWIKDLENQQEDRIMSGGYKVINQKVDYEIPLLSWADNSTLGIVNYVKSKTTLWLYDITTRNKIPTRFERFEKVHSFSFSGNGRLAIMSADVSGVNDLYLVSVTRSRIKRLTNDLYDEINPTFIPNSNIILFSSNRVNDTLSIVPESIEEVESNFNLFLYNLDTTRMVVMRVTNTVSRDLNPRAFNYSDFYYLSDQKGIQNLFKYDLRDSIYGQVSNYSSNIRQYDLNFTEGRAAFVMEHGNQSNIYIDYNFDRDKSIFTSATRLQRAKQSRAVTNRRNESLTTQSNPVELDFTKQDTAKVEIVEKADIIDTDNYVFDREVDTKERSDQPESFLSQYRRFQTQKSVFGPLDYETRFSADNLVTSWVIDPMIGFGFLIETQMKDVLEDHSFKGSIMGTTDFRSGDFIGEYKYLRGMIDIGFRFYRRVMEWTTEDIPQKYKKNVIELNASYPLSVRTRFSLKPFFGNTQFEDLDFALLGPGPGNPASVNRNFIGIKSELVFDNSISKGMNIIEGTRAKVSFKHWEGITEKNSSFSNFSVDIRHYQKISREFVFATRLFYGKFFGRNNPNYLLGGVDNWLFSKTKNRGDSENQSSPLYTARNEDNSNLLFLEYVTPMRGFSFNTFYGTDALVLNAELRLPIIKYFYKGPISSNFFRNLQFVGFYDIGSAWTGANPFSEDNEVNTLVIDSGLFRSEIMNYRSPWLQSFGVGLRTVILGFFMKFDLAYPIENFERGKPKFQASFGFDF